MVENQKPVCRISDLSGFFAWLGKWVLKIIAIQCLSTLALGRPHAACLWTWSHWSQMATFRRGGRKGEGILREAVHSVITLLTCTPGQRSCEDRLAHRVFFSEGTDTRRGEWWWEGLPRRREVRPRRSRKGLSSLEDPPTRESFRRASPSHSPD